MLARVVAIVGQLKPAGMAKHVRVDREWHVGSLTEALDKPVETDGADWPAALGNEYVGVCRVIARSLRSARISSPRIGCTLGIPFLTR
jgi:hypothetical protein